MGWIERYEGWRSGNFEGGLAFYCCLERLHERSHARPEEVGDLPWRLMTDQLMLQQGCDRVQTEIHVVKGIHCQRQFELYECGSLEKLVGSGRRLASS